MESGPNSFAARGQSPESLDVRAFIDGARFSLYQKILLGLCVCTAFFDGFDIQALAVAAPLLRAELHISAIQLGSLFAIGSLGGIITGFGLTPIADRLGRRPLIIGAVIVSGALTLLYTTATSIEMFMALRLTSGIALAIAITMAYAYAAESAPKRLAATCVVVTSAGFGLGVAATGFVSGWLLPLAGWRSIFYFGGGACMLLGAILFFVLPESVRVLAQRGRHHAQVRRFLLRIAPGADLPEHSTFHLDEERRSGLHLSHLLKDGRALQSVGVWVAYFFVNFVIYVFMQWLPSLVTSAGGTAGQAGDSIGWFKLAGIVGSFVCAFYIDRRRNPYPIFALFLGSGALSCFVLSDMSPGLLVFMSLVAITGFFLSGPLYAATGVMARLFPTYVRGAGLSITALVGRTGNMVGPFTVGVLLQSGWSNHQVILWSVAPAVVATVIFLALAIRFWSSVPRPEPA